MKKKPVELAANSPVLPLTPTQDVVYALKALVAGAADAGQQGLAMRWIVNALCGTYDFSYRPDSQRDTDVALGKQFVGQQLVRLVNMPVDRVATLPKMGGATPGEDDELPNM